MSDPTPPAPGATVDAPRRVHVAVPFLIVTLVWSSTWIVVRGQLGAVPPSWSVTYRFAIAAAAMFAYAAATRASLRLTPRQHALCAVYGVVQYAVNYYAVYVAERSVTSGLVAVVFALLVVPNAVLGRVFLRQGISRPFAIGSAIAMLGVAAMFRHELEVAPTGDRRLATGIAWTLLAVVSASIGNVLQAKRAARAVPVASLVAWGMAWGSAIDAFAAWAIDGPPVAGATWAYWGGVLYLALAGSSLAFTCYFHVLRTIGPARAAYATVLTPGIAMILSTVFEGYRWTASAAAGAALVAAGLVVALRARQSASPTR